MRLEVNGPASFNSMFASIGISIHHPPELLETSPAEGHERPKQAPSAQKLNRTR